MDSGYTSLSLIYWIIIIIGTLFYIGTISANAHVLFNWILHKKQGSTIPLIGGIVGGIIIAFFPIKNINSYWWIPPALDASYYLYIYGMCINIKNRFTSH